MGKTATIRLLKAISGFAHGVGAGLVGKVDTYFLISIANRLLTNEKSKPFCQSRFLG